MLDSIYLKGGMDIGNDDMPSYQHSGSQIRKQDGSVYKSYYPPCCCLALFRTACIVDRICLMKSVNYMLHLCIR